MNTRADSDSSNGEEEYNQESKRNLFLLTRRAIWYGFTHDRIPRLHARDYPPELWEKRASFVTLRIQEELRGCIGNLEANRPLALDISHNAQGAAFRDPRFPPLEEAEFDNLNIHLSILGPPAPIEFLDESDLLGRLAPGTDGLILAADGYRATFLPDVWKNLPGPRDFLNALKKKAGLPGGYPLKKVSIYRYSTVSISEV